MNLTLKIAMLSCAGLAPLTTLAGCKVTSCTETSADGGSTTKENCVQLEPTVEYRDARLRVGGQAWTSGHSVSITNRNGALKVAVGSAGDERVQFSGIAFTREGKSDAEAQKAKDHLGAMADPAFTGGDSIILVAPGGGVDGYDLTVWLPTDFDATLTIDNQNGTLTLYGAEGTLSTTATSHAILASNLKHTINLHSMVGDIDVSGLPSGADNVIRAEVGDISARIGAANLAITAKSDLGMVTFPTDWTTQMVSADHTSGTATLGDGSGTLSATTGNGNVTFSTQ